jgi:excisionase family DNA binding protein
MSVTDLAKYLGVTPAWVYNNHRALDIPGRKIGGHLRFRLADVDRWIERECKPAA